MTHPDPVDRDTIERALEDSSLRKWEREWVLHRLDSVEGLEQSVDLWYKRYQEALALATAVGAEFAQVPLPGTNPS